MTDFPPLPEGTYWRELKRENQGYSAADMREYVLADRASRAHAQDAEQALLKVLDAVQRYLPPDGTPIMDAMSEIIGIVDPWPLAAAHSVQAPADDVRASPEFKAFARDFDSKWDAAAPSAQAEQDDDGCPHGNAYIVYNCRRCGAPVCCDKCCAEDEQARQAAKDAAAGAQATTGECETDAAPDAPLPDPWRSLYSRIILHAAAIIQQRHWGSPIDGTAAGTQDDALARLAMCARNIADDLAGAALAGIHAAPVDDVRAALDRITHSYRLLLAGKPVRDASETLAEADAALSAQQEGGKS